LSICFFVFFIIHVMYLKMQCPRRENSLRGTGTEYYSAKRSNSVVQQSALGTRNTPPESGMVRVHIVVPSLSLMLFPS